MHKLDKVGVLLGVTTRELFVRAHKAYGGARDNPTSDYNKYCAFGTVPNYVDKLCVSELERQARKRR